MAEVTALGEVLIDFTDAGTSEGGQKLFERNPGGAPANVLVALERLGHKTAFIGKVGDDMHGRFLKQVMDDNGVDTSNLVIDPNFFTTLAFVALSPTGERTFSFARKPGADTQLAPAELDRDLIAGSRVFHVGSLSLTDEPARSATMTALRVARDAGVVVSYDPNYRDTLWDGPEVAAGQMRTVIPYVDVMKLSDEECELVTGRLEPAMAAEWLLEQGVKVCVVTLGADGAFVATHDGSAVVPGYAADVVDTTGAGDSFWGGFLAGLLESGLAPADVDIAAAQGFVRLGNAVASLTVRGRGGIPSIPERKDVEALLAK